MNATATETATLHDAMLAIRQAAATCRSLGLLWTARMLETECHEMIALRREEMLDSYSWNMQSARAAITAAKAREHEELARNLLIAAGGL